MNHVTQQLIAVLTENDQAGEAVARIIEGSASRKMAAKTLRNYLSEVLPNGSVRVRSLFAASGDVAQVYAGLLRAALASVQWKKLVDALKINWELDTVWELAYPVGNGNEQGTDDGTEKSDPLG